MFTVVTVTLGRDRLVSDSTLVFAPNVLRFPKVVPDAALDEPDRSIRNFCTFQTDAKNFWWEGKTRFLVLDGTQHRLPLTSEMTDIFFPDSPSKYILKIFFVHYNLILWLYVRVCLTGSLTEFVKKATFSCIRSSRDHHLDPAAKPLAPSLVLQVLLNLRLQITYWHVHYEGISTDTEAL